MTLQLVDRRAGGEADPQRDEPRRDEPPRDPSAGDPPQGGRPLPDASRRNLLHVLSLVRSVAPDQKFSQAWLSSQGLGQSRQALRLLRFMCVVGSHNKLKQDVLDVRADCHAFRQLLEDRARRHWALAGFSPRHVEMLVSPVDDWSGVRDELKVASPLSRLKQSVQNNVLGCCRALNEALNHMRYDGWLQRELNELSTAKNGGGGLAPPAGATASTSAPQDVFQFPYAYMNSHTYWARVVFEGPINPQLVRVVGRQLQQMADTMESQATDSRHGQPNG